MVAPENRYHIVKIYNPTNLANFSKKNLLNRTTNSYRSDLIVANSNSITNMIFVYFLGDNDQQTGSQLMYFQSLTYNVRQLVRIQNEFSLGSSGASYQPANK